MRLKLTRGLLAANLEVKSKAPNGVTFTVKGKNAHEGPISGNVSFGRPCAIYIYMCRLYAAKDKWKTMNS